MNDKNDMLLSVAQQGIYVDTVFAMARLDGFERVGAPDEGDDRPPICAKRMGEYTVEIGWMDEDELGPDATKAVWQVEVIEHGAWKSQIVYVGLHASDALRIAKGLVRFHHTLTQPLERERRHCSLAG
jgi:hypothetical protein